MRLLLLCLIISTILALFSTRFCRVWLFYFLTTKKNCTTWNLTRSAQLSRVAADCQLVGLGQSERASDELSHGYWQQAHELTTC